MSRGPNQLCRNVPPELSPTAQREWARLTVELSKLNLMTNLDRGALATYCGAYAMWAEAMEQIQKYGTMVKSPTGFPIQSPYLAIANRAGRNHDAHCVRVRLHACKPEPHLPKINSRSLMRLSRKADRLAMWDL